MGHVDGSLARSLDFGEGTVKPRPIRRATAGPRSGSQPARRPLELLRGLDKYTVLERRRRAAQIKARHALNLIELMERAAEGK